MNLDIISSLSGGSSDPSGFMNPWIDLASTYAPRTIVSALELSEFLYVNDSTYKMASERIVSYFLSELKFMGQADEERKKFEDLIKNDVDLIGNMQAAGNDLMTYGNSFTTISMPFTRVLICGECKRETNIEHIPFKYNSSEATFSTYCPKCKVDKRHFVKDYKKKDSKGIELVRWNPKFITIKANRLTHNTEYWTDIPHEIKSGITTGDPFYVRTTPLPFLQAIKKDTQFKFKEGHLFHMKEPHLAGLWLGGWGLPSILSSFKNFFRLQVLRRYNEVLMMDYIVPIRIISPKQGSYQDGNSIYNNMMRTWTNEMQNAVVRHRSDGTDWNFFPFPVEYQPIGGEGTQLAPTEMIKDEEDRMLNGRGIPPELYRSSMTLQAAPVSLRVFERGWSHLVRGLNLLAQESVSKISSYMGSGDYECELESVKIIDDLENKAWRLQAMQANLISKATAMGPMGISDPEEEYKKILEEQSKEQELSKETQEEAQMSQMGLINPQDPNGQDKQGGGATPENVNQEADDMARKLLQMPDSERRRQLTSIRSSNDTLHALVLKKMEQLRNQARSVGGEQALPSIVQNGAIPAGGGDPSVQPETDGATPQQGTPAPPPQ